MQAAMGGAVYPMALYAEGADVANEDFERMNDIDGPGTETSDDIPPC